jgi:hypothetical protein
MSQQVGFNLQGDVFLGSSLVYSGAGRLLKLLSDAGVDTYAVAAVLELGKQVPISQHHETIVSAALLKRQNSRSGFLVQSLRIGWGCNDAAYELSRTREGSAALMLADAFAAGRTYYLAAQALQELISLSGCHRDFLPSVTVLKGLISHIAPIMQDSGFQTTLAHIRTTSIIALRRLYQPLDAELFLIPVSADRGAPRGWAGAVKQLMLVASQGEAIHIHTNTRGAWLAAFAVHLLSMECTLLHSSNVLWHAAGSQGSVTIQLAEDIASPVPRFWCSLTLQPRKDLAHPQALETFYLLKDALQTELSLFPDLSLDFQEDIKHKIVEKVLFTIRVLSIEARFPDPKRVKGRAIRGTINASSFDHRNLVTTALEKVGIDPGVLCYERPSEETINDKAYEENLELPAGMPTICFCELDSPNGHKREHQPGSCRQYRLNALVNGVVSTVTALLLCEANSSNIQVAASIFNGTSTTLLYEHVSFPFERYQGSWGSHTTFNMLLGHLRRLVHGEATSESELPDSCLAVSAGAVTVAFKVLFDEEIFTDDGFIIALYSDRISADGEFREYVEDLLPDNKVMRDPLLESWSIAEGVPASPPSADGIIDIRSGFEMAEYSFKVSCNVYRSTKEIYLPGRDSTTNPYPIAHCLIQPSLVALLQAEVGVDCGHSREEPFVAPASCGAIKIRAAHFCVDASVMSRSYTCTLVGTQGEKLKQLFAFAYVNDTLLFRQGASCLPCAFDQASPIFERTKHHWERLFIICE